MITDNLYTNLTGDTGDIIWDIMKTDIKEREGQYLIEIELPGYKKENIIAQLEKGVLTIKAIRNEGIENSDIKTTYIMKERSVGEVKRSFYVGDGVQQSHITASLKDGILSILIVGKDKMIEENDIKLINIE